MQRKSLDSIPSPVCGNNINIDKKRIAAFGRAVSPVMGFDRLISRIRRPVLLFAQDSNAI